MSIERETVMQGEDRVSDVKFEQKTQYTVEDLIEIVRILRSPGGCPWDREQTHRSIRKNLIEETYEVAEAIDLEDAALLREELGDLLLQVVLHARMEEEEGRPGFDGVCDGICKKLIERHPHVFGGVQVNSTGDVLGNWERIKQRSKGQTTVSETLRSVPGTLPALMRAQKVQQRTARVGLTPSDAEWAMGDLRAEMAELQEAVESGKREAVLDEMGDVFFAAVQVARSLNTDAEEILNAATNKIVGRFERAEAIAAQKGFDLKNCPSGEFNVCWRAAKAN